MTQASDFSADSLAHTDTDETIHGAWLGPAIGASILTLAWASYLVPLLIGIFSIGV